MQNRINIHKFIQSLTNDWAISLKKVLLGYGFHELNIGFSEIANANLEIFLSLPKNRNELCKLLYSLGPIAGTSYKEKLVPLAREGLNKLHNAAEIFNGMLDIPDSQTILSNLVLNNLTQEITKLADKHPNDFRQFMQNLWFCLPEERFALLKQFKMLINVYEEIYSSNIEYARDILHIECYLYCIIAKLNYRDFAPSLLEDVDYMDVRPMRSFYSYLKRFDDSLITQRFTMAFYKEAAAIQLTSSLPLYIQQKRAENLQSMLAQAIQNPTQFTEDISQFISIDRETAVSYRQKLIEAIRQLPAHINTETHPLRLCSTALDKYIDRTYDESLINELKQRFATISSFLTKIKLTQELNSLYKHIVFLLPNNEGECLQLLENCQKLLSEPFVVFFNSDEHHLFNVLSDAIEFKMQIIKTIHNKFDTTFDKLLNVTGKYSVLCQPQRRQATPESTYLPIIDLPSPLNLTLSRYEENFDTLIDLPPEMSTLFQDLNENPNTLFHTTTTTTTTTSTITTAHRNTVDDDDDIEELPRKRLKS